MLTSSMLMTSLDVFNQCEWRQSWLDEWRHRLWRCMTSQKREDRNCDHVIMIWYWCWFRFRFLQVKADWLSLSIYWLPAIDLSVLAMSATYYQTVRLQCLTMFCSSWLHFCSPSIASLNLTSGPAHPWLVIPCLSSDWFIHWIIDRLNYRLIDLLFYQ